MKSHTIFHFGSALLALSLLVAGSATAQAQQAPPTAGTVTISMSSPTPNAVYTAPATVHVAASFTATAGKTDVFGQYRSVCIDADDNQTGAGDDMFFLAAGQSKTTPEDDVVTLYAGSWFAKATIALNGTNVYGVASSTGCPFTVNMGRTDEDKNLDPNPNPVLVG